MANINHLPSLIRRACCCTLAAFALPTFAAIPVRWTVDTFRVKPLVYDCYHGETLDLAADMTAYGEPLNLAGKTAHLFWQTNGMAGVYWQTNAAVRVSSAATNVLAAVFSGAFDPGASEVQGFIGVDGENYRAAFTLRFRPSPGFVPSALPLPREVIDCATVSFTHPEASPFLQRGEIPAPDLSPATNYTDACCRTLAAAQTNYTCTATNDLATALRGEIAAHVPGNYAAVSNAAMTAVQPAALDNYLPTSWAYDPNSTFAGKAASADYSFQSSIAGTLAFDPANPINCYIYWDTTENRWLTCDQNMRRDYLACVSELPSTNGFITAESDPLWSANSNNFATTILAVAERGAESKIERGYTPTNAVVALTQSVQYINPDGTAVSVVVPPAIDGGIRDWVIYAYPTAATEISFAALTHAKFADDSVTNALPANVYTAIYITEIDPATGTFAIGRAKLEKGW